MPTITTPAELSDTRLALSGQYILGADIDLSGYANWDPIGTAANPFTGTLDGAGYTISNLTISRSGTDNVGLFGVCSFTVAETRLIDVVITGTDVTGQDNVGALAGQIITDKFVDPGGFDLVSGCSSVGTVNGRNNVGGLIGYAQGPAYAGHVGQPSGAMVFDYLLARIAACYSAAVVTGTGTHIGGLIGQTSEIRPYRSRATGAVTGGDIVGGLVGRHYRSASEWVYATGAVIGDKTAGGLIGQNYGRPMVIRSYAEGDVTGIGVFDEPTNFIGCGIGGLIGDTELEGIDYCYALGNVSGRYRVGGLVGSCYGGDSRSPNIIASFAHGNVSAVKAAGGIFGYVYAKYGVFTQLYCAGSVAGINRGAIIGEVGRPPQDIWPGAPAGTPTFMDTAFYNSEVNSAPNTNGGQGRTAAQLGTDTNYNSAWQFFDRIWAIDPEESPYPVLLAFYDPLTIALASAVTTAGTTVAYTREGKVYRRTYTGSWGAETEITDLPATCRTVSLFVAPDDRLGYIAEAEDGLHFAVTEAGTLTVEYSGFLLPGAQGNLAHLGDRLKTYLVTQIGSVAESESVSVDWADLGFSEVAALPSDSYVSFLRAKYLQDETWMVWRSRGQHRILRRVETEDETVTIDVPAGTITVRDDTPVVQLTLEFDREEGD